jgi:hypothetical protein
LGYFSPTHEQGHGPAQGDSATTAVTLVTPSLTPAFSPRRRRIVRRPLENSRDWICRMDCQATRKHDR